MRRLALLSLLLGSAPASARRKSDAQPVVQSVPSIEEVVTNEGFVPTPSQSETYSPGVVLVPNTQGGHDVVHRDCIGVEPDVSIMSQSSIATSLSAGVSARLSAVRGHVAGGIEKRLSFVDPEQRTIPFSALNPTDECAAGLETAARFTDLSQAIVVYDVLVAQIQNTVCTKADASGSVMLLGEVEAAAFSECVQESDAQVPLGFKFVPLSQVFTSAVATSPTPAPVIPSAPVSATTSVDFGTTGGLDIDAQLKEQECDRMAEVKGAAARAARLRDAESAARAKATTAWRSLQGDLEKCTQLKQAARAMCVTAANQWLTQARAMPVSIPAGVEPVETACGLRQPAFAADSRTVVADEVAAAEAVLVRLEAPDRTAQGRVVGESDNGSNVGTSAATGGGGASWIGGDPTIMGALDRGRIDAVIKPQMNQIGECYLSELANDPDLGGKITIKFIVARDGSVSKASVKSSTMVSRPVESCIVKRFMRFEFPEPKGGGVVIVGYPITFSPG